MNLNKVVILGNVTQDPDVRTTPSGDKVANFSVATNRFWKDKTTGEKQQKAEFHNVVAWRRHAEIAEEYLNKGGLVMVEGHLETRSWEGDDGKKNYRTEIIADNIQLGPRRSEGSSQSSTPAKDSENKKEPSGDSAKGDSEKEEDIPTVDADSPSNSDDEIDVKDIPF